MKPAFIATRRQHAGARAVERRKVRAYTDQAAHDQNNLACALLIASAPEKYPAGSALARWAQIVLAKADGKAVDAGMETARESKFDHAQLCLAEAA